MHNKNEEKEIKRIESKLWWDSLPDSEKIRLSKQHFSLCSQTPVHYLSMIAQIFEIEKIKFKLDIDRQSV